MRRWIIGIAIAVVALLAIVAGAGWAFLELAGDEPPPAVGDLEPRTASVPDSENIFNALETIGKPWWPAPGTEDYDEKYDKLLEMPSGGEWDPALAAEALEKNRAFLAAFDAAVSRPVMQVQVPKDSSAIPYEGPAYLLDLRRACEVACVRILALSHQEKEAEALDRALEIMRLGHALQGAGGTIADFLSGASFQSIACTLVRKIVSEARLPDDRLAACQASLGRFADSRDALRETLRSEYELFAMDLYALGAGRMAYEQAFLGVAPSDIRQMVDDLLLRSPRLLMANRTRRLAAEAIRGLILDAGKPASERRVPGYNPVAAAAAFSRWKRNSAGELVLAWRIYPLHKLFDRADETECQVSATRVLIALRRYSLAKGALPDSLEELVPAFLPAVPRDPYDGKPLRYSREKKVVYAVGKDLSDSGGDPKGRGGWEPRYSIDF